MQVNIQDAQGVPLTRIATNLSIDRKTARKLRDAGAEPTVTVRRRKSQLDEYADWIRERLAAGVPAAQLARDLKRRGVAVPYPTLRDFARKLRPVKEPTPNEVRFETPPAKQAQCDWSTIGTILDRGVVLPLYLFVMVLGYSRKMFARFATSMDELTLQRLHVAAFRAFGGVPLEVLYDNMKTVTVGRDDDFQPVLQSDFADFSALYGFTVKCAKPYCPKTKGKVERTIGFVQTSFLPGRAFTAGLDDAQRQLDEWVADVNTRVHRTHGEVIDERFAREAPLLTLLRPDLGVIGVRTTRRVNAEGFVDYHGSRYQVPAGHRGKTVLIRDTGEHVRIFAADALLYEHPSAAGRGQVLRIAALAPSLARQLETIVVEHRPLAVYDEVNE